jgi:hypothetical protein
MTLIRVTVYNDIVLQGGVEDFQAAISWRQAFYHAAALVRGGQGSEWGTGSGNSMTHRAQECSHPHLSNFSKLKHLIWRPVI